MVSETLAAIKKLEGTEIQNSKSEAGNWLRPRLEKIERGKVTLSVLIRKEMCNPFGNIHGGMMALIVDEAIGWAVVSLEAPSHYTSISLNLDFLYAAAEGARIRALASVVRQGKKIIYVEVAVFNEANILLCKAASNLVVTGMKPVG